jgi:hypothetical protein
MSFPDFLKEFKSKYQNPKNAFNYVFGSQRMELDEYKPTLGETSAFIEFLRAAILLEKKSMSNDRAAALDKLLNYNKNPGTPYFPGIDPHVFAFQLALRIREPSLLNQAKVGICGENSLMIFFAKKTPSQFAEYAISLMRTGSGKFHGLPVNPPAKTWWLGESIWESYKDRLAEADFVTIASLASLFGDIKEGTTPDEVCKLLSKAGFPNTQKKVDERETFPGSADSIRNLNEAAAALNANKIVILAVHADFIVGVRALKDFYARNWDLDELRRGSGKKYKEWEWETPIKAELQVEKRKPGTRAQRHWILVTYLEPTQTEVTVKLYSWQNPLYAEFKRDTFLSYYEGYVAADLPAEPAAETEN